MSTRKLTDIDFMMMDVHRPHLKSEIEAVHLQAVVDKSYPHEHPLPENVEYLPTVTMLDLTPEEILRRAHDAELTSFVIVGVDETGREFIFRTCSDRADAAWHLQRGLHRLNKEVDGDDDHPHETGDEVG